MIENDNIYVLACDMEVKGEVETLSNIESKG